MYQSLSEEKKQKAKICLWMIQKFFWSRKNQKTSVLM